MQKPTNDQEAFPEYVSATEWKTKQRTQITVSYGKLGVAGAAAILVALAFFLVPLLARSNRLNSIVSALKAAPIMDSQVFLVGNHGELNLFEREVLNNGSWRRDFGQRGPSMFHAKNVDVLLDPHWTSGLKFQFFNGFAPIRDRLAALITGQIVNGGQANVDLKSGPNGDEVIVRDGVRQYTIEVSKDRLPTSCKIDVLAPTGWVLKEQLSMEYPREMSNDEFTTPTAKPLDLVPGNGFTSRQAYPKKIGTFEFGNQTCNLLGWDMAEDGAVTFALSGLSGEARCIVTDDQGIPYGGIFTLNVGEPGAPQRIWALPLEGKSVRLPVKFHVALSQEGPNEDYIGGFDVLVDRTTCGSIPKASWSGGMSDIPFITRQISSDSQRASAILGQNIDSMDAQALSISPLAPAQSDAVADAMLDRIELEEANGTSNQTTIGWHWYQTYVVLKRLNRPEEARGALSAARQVAILTEAKPDDQLYIDVSKALQDEQMTALTGKS